MTKEQLINRIQTLETERENLKGTVMVYDGAIQDCQYWLSQLAKEERKENSDG